MSFLVNENDNLNDLFPPIPLSSGGHILGADDQQLLSNLTVDLEIMNSTTCEVTDTSTSSSSLFKTHNERYEALIARNPAANGQFLYCVTSTKVGHNLAQSEDIANSKCR